MSNENKYENHINNNQKYYGWQPIFQDLKYDLENFFGKYSSIKITLASKNNLPIIVNEIPDFLLDILSKQPDYYKLRFHYFQNENDNDYPLSCGTKYLFYSNNKWIYVEHFPGSESGYKCCEQLHVFIAESLIDLQFHVPEKDLNDLLPKISV